MDLTPVARRSLPDEVFAQLVDQIVEGSLAPGDALPSERRLAEVLDVSRPAVREALQRLSGSGLVATRHGGATTVQDFRRTGGLDLLPRLMMRVDGIDLAGMQSNPDGLEALLGADGGLDFGALMEQRFAEVTAEEPGTAEDDDASMIESLRGHRLAFCQNGARCPRRSEFVANQEKWYSETVLREFWCPSCKSSQSSSSFSTSSSHWR